MKDFTYQYGNESMQGGVIIYFKDGYKRYRVNPVKSETLVIAPCGFRQTNGNLIWVQEMKQGVVEYPIFLVQSIGDGIEKCDWWVDDIPI